MADRLNIQNLCGLLNELMGNAYRYYEIYPYNNFATCNIMLALSRRLIGKYINLLKSLPKISLNLWQVKRRL